MEENNKPFIAYIILVFAVVIYAAVQLVIVAGDHGQLQNAMKSSMPVADNARMAQTNLESFVVDLIELAKTNEGARQIIEKYQIRKGGE